MVEQTLVIIKPDGLQRGLSGQIISRFENVGLKLVACKMVRATKGILEKHYSDDKAYITSLGQKTKDLYESYQYDIKATLGKDDPYELGLEVRNRLIDYMLMAPVILLVWEGVEAISLVRKMVGSTTPMSADVGTIRGDFSHDSQFSAPQKGRALMTIVHASGNKEEAKHEIKLWFGKDFAPAKYTRVDEMYF